MNNQVISYNLQSARIRNGWSQSLVCKLTGISQRTLSRIENGASASKNTIKKLCNLYKIDMESLYESEKPVRQIKIDLLSDDTLYYILQRNTLLADLQREVILRFTAVAGKGAVMDRNDIEAVLSDALTDKTSYSYTDIISACMAINESTIQKITNMAVA